MPFYRRWQAQVKNSKEKKNKYIYSIYSSIDAYVGLLAILCDLHRIGIKKNQNQNHFAKFQNNNNICQFYVFSSIWGHSSYQLFGILIIVFVILIVVTTCITVALTYFQVNQFSFSFSICFVFFIFYLFFLFFRFSSIQLSMEDHRVKRKQFIFFR